MFQLRKFWYIKEALSAWLIFSLVLQVVSVLLLQLLFLIPQTAQAAEKVVDPTATGVSGSNNTTGTQTVFTGDQTGYTFYRDSTGQCVYSKTSDGGSSWSASTLVDSQTDCLKIVVWYDRWTPGDTGDFIHIATLDNSLDDMFYNRLDTTTDTLLTGSSPTNVSINSGQTPTISVNANTHSLTKATDGSVFMALSDGSDSYVVSCSASCNNQTNWNEVGVSPLDLQNDHSLLMPLSGGSVLLINRDISANDLRSSVWNGTSWSSWSTIDTDAPENAIYDGGLAATVDTASGNIYLVYAADHNDAVADHDIRTAIYDGSGWTNTTSVFTNSPNRGVHQVGIGFDQNTGDVYVSYSAETSLGTANSSNVYWVQSSDAMTTWGTEQGPLNTDPDTFYSPQMSLNSFERMYVTWWDDSDNEIVGDTITNIGPDTLLATIGTVKSEVRSPSANFNVGAAFVISSQSARNISSFRLSETGTVNGDTELSNIALFYELDTTAPYDCVDESFSGTELQFGSTDTNGFSAADGTATFSGTVVGIDPTSTACFYPVIDVLSSADNGDTIVLSVSDPVNDITVSGTTIFPEEQVTLDGVTTVLSPDLTQNHYHWRNDDGSETGATSATAGNQDTSQTAVVKNTNTRLRLDVSNEGGTSSLATTFQLEYGVAAPTCQDVSTWTDVGAATDAWDMSDSPNIVDGANTSNISAANGGVTDEASTFVSPNGALRDTQSTTSAITIGVNEFVEVEYSIIATDDAVEGESYCFRVTDEGSELSFYTRYAEATIDADVRVSAVGSQISSAEIPQTNVYFGGAFAIADNSGTRTVTDITIAETGTIDASTGLRNIQLFYETDTSAPYNCASESYDGSELQYGSTDADGFSGSNGTSTFSDSVTISTTASLCTYVVADVTSSAVNGETILFEITSGLQDVVVSTGSVAPATPVALLGTTTLSGGALTQTQYQWRNDDGSETDATSATGGVANTPLTNFDLSKEIRLRIGVSNEGATTSVPTRFQLEFAPRITTCANVPVWTDVDAEAVDDWDMSDSVHLVNGSDTSNIPESNGGVSDENLTFLTPNGGVRDTESTTGSTTLTSSDFVDLEFSITSTANTLNDLTYCFRVSSEGEALQAYSAYPQVSTVVKRDFKTQRGNVVISGTSTTLTAGTDYIAPISSTSAFIRITNSNYTGAGSSLTGSQNANDVTAYIKNPQDLSSAVTIARPPGAINDTYVDWEIVEFVGQAGTDNEMIVRDSGVVNFSNTQLSVTAPSISVMNDASVVVFVTGVGNQDTFRNYYAGQVTSDWSAGSNEPVFTRGATGGSEADISYAVVEFTGLNWNVQRIEHRFDSAGASTSPISAVSSLEQTFLYTQKRMGASTNVVHFGYTAWLSSIGAITFELSAGANTTIEQTAVAWVIENTQTGSNGMKVQRQNGLTSGGVEPLTLAVTISEAVGAVSNSSIFINSFTGGSNNAYPRPIVGARITANDTYEIWRSDTGGSALNYRTEIVEYPVADLAIRQNYYRFYNDNDAVTPADPWPPGTADLGENTSITVNDEPLGEDDIVRMRMSVKVSNANMPAGLQEFKLQFAQRISTCTAVSNWSDVGEIASSTVWRGYAGTSTTDGTALSSDPSTPGDLLISVSDVAGSLEHENNSVANPYVAFDGEDVEYDWFLQQSGATPETNYCFRMIRSDGTELDGYLHYPQIRTAGFSPATKNWRWYDDPENETPVSPLVGENSAPVSIDIDDTLVLRTTVRERANVNGPDTKFKLEFSENALFFDPQPVVSTTSCQANSLWCYVEGVVADNTRITTSVLSDSDSCSSGAGDGCGTQNSDPEYRTGHTQGALQSQEYSFTLKHSGARVNAVYYFRLVDAATDIPVPLDLNEAYPSVVSGPSSLTFSVAGLPAGTSTAGVITTASTTGTTVTFGELTFNTDVNAAQRISVETNATEGYQVLKYASQDLLNDYGEAIASVNATNQSPAGWSTTCSASSTGCVGYHTTDSVLSNGSTRFAAEDTYSGLSTSPVEIMFNSGPVNDTIDVVYRVRVSELQPAGDYVTDITYLAVPVF